MDYLDLVWLVFLNELNQSFIFFCYGQLVFIWHICRNLKQILNQLFSLECTFLRWFRVLFIQCKNFRRIFIYQKQLNFQFVIQPTMITYSISFLLLRLILQSYDVFPLGSYESLTEPNVPSIHLNSHHQSIPKQRVLFHCYCVRREFFQVTIQFHSLQVFLLLHFHISLRDIFSPAW